MKLQTIDEIMSEFDFKRVHKVMKALKWRWYMRIGDEYVQDIPTLKQIKECARDLLNRVVVSNSTYIATGGFRAYKNEDLETSEMELGLAFEVSDWYREVSKEDMRKIKLKKILGRL